MCQDGDAEDGMYMLGLEDARENREEIAELRESRKEIAELRKRIDALYAHLHEVHHCNCKLD